MSELRCDQANFTKGQLDRRVQARIDYQGYYQSAKLIENCIVIPQGGVSNRWGTTYVDTVPLSAFDQTSYQYSEVSTLIYDSSTVYLLLWTDRSLKIYLENTLVATVVTTYLSVDIQDLRFGQVDNRIIITNPNFNPRQLIRSASSANVIAGVDTVNNYITLTTAGTVGQILPLTFTTGGTLPVTSPQIYVARPYFMRFFTSTAVRIYNTAEDAANDVNYFLITAAGTGNAVAQNNWAISNITFTYMPSFDFSGGYNTITFTPGAVSGAAVVLTASAAIFTAAMVGGVFHGNGGIMRLNIFTDSTHMTGTTLEDFTDTTAILGSLAFLGEPAWSVARGWPRCVSFFQNRLALAGSASIPNGVWLSVVNEAYNFDDSESLDDNAISWYPAGGLISYISSITSCRTLLFHTNTGVFSTPVGSEVPLTPKNFTLIEQNKVGSSDIQPVYIDNQVVYVDKSGNNVRNMIWEISQSSYVLNNISVTASDVINKPIDMAAFADPDFADGSFIFFINVDGTLAVFQTLYEQDVLAWSVANTKTTTAAPASYFQRVTTALNKCYFLVKRQISIAGVLSYATYIEQLDFTVYTDCTIKKRNINTANITGLDPLDGSTVQIVGDGFVVAPQLVENGLIAVPEPVVDANVGLAYTATLSLLPVNNVLGDGNNLYKAKHIRSFYVYYYQTIGAQLQGFEIPAQDLQEVILNAVPVPATGVYNYTLMEGWDGFAFDINFVQSLPLPMTILGVSYVMEA